jgi:single-stranded DNA-binding protein
MIWDEDLGNTVDMYRRDFDSDSPSSEHEKNAVNQKTAMNTINLAGRVNNISFSNQVQNPDHMVCTFTLAMERASYTTWVRVNVFNSQLVDECRALLEKDAHVVVRGELMNRFSNNRQERVTEVRALSIWFCKD